LSDGTPACATCGYVVEFVRSAHNGTWHLFRDNPSARTLGRYYFAPPDTPHFPARHNLWDRDWLDKNWRNEVVIGPDLAAPQPWYNGAAPTVLPRVTTAGTQDCVTNGERYALRLVRGSPDLINGFPRPCFTQADIRDIWMQVAAIDRCSVQKLWIRIINWMYADDSVSIATTLHQWLGAGRDVRWIPATVDFPALTIVVDPEFTIVCMDGTRRFQQLALQAWDLLQGPQNFGIFATTPFWYDASTYVINQLEAIPININAPIVCIGHSYGAVVAALLAARLRAGNAVREVLLLTYGMPKPGDANLIAWLDRCRQVHLVNDIDIVTTLPPDYAHLWLVVPLLGTFALGLWPGWQRAQQPLRLDEFGNATPDWAETPDAFTLGFMVSQALSHQSLNAFIGHTPDEYLRRLQRRCPFDEWPLPPIVNEEITGILGMKFDGGITPSNAYAKIAFGGGIPLPPGQPGQIAFNDGGGLVHVTNLGTAGAIAFDGDGVVNGVVNLGTAGAIAFDGDGVVTQLAIEGTAGAIAFDGDGVVTPPDSHAGEIAFNGEGHVQLPITPGSSCSLAGLMTIGDTYNGTHGGFGTNQWFRVPITNGVQIHVTISGSNPASNCSIGHGSSCPPTNLSSINTTITPCYAYTPGATENLYLQVPGVFSGSTAYTISVLLGPC